MKAVIKDKILYSPYPEINIPRCSLYAAMKEFLMASPEKVALIDDTTRLTRGEFFVRMQRFAAGFQSLGIGIGARVGVYLENSVDNAVALFALTFTGASILLLYPTPKHDETCFRMRHCDATHLLTSSQCWSSLSPAMKELNLKGILMMGEAGQGFVSVSNFAELDECDFNEVTIEDPENTIVGIFYSSGTTGQAKGMELTHYALVANLHMTKLCMTYEPEDVVLPSFSLTHLSGFISIPATTCHGAPCVLVKSGFSFDQFVHYVKKYEVTTIATLPWLLHSFVESMALTGTELPSIKKITVGSAPLTKALADATLAAFRNLRSLRNPYGLCEAGGVICSPSGHEHEPGNVGFPLPMAQIKFVDVNSGELLGPNQPGELHFRTPSMINGYHKSPDLWSAMVDEEGWCKSGDMCYHDDGGQVHFVDRMKDLIKCRSKYISSFEIESILQGHEVVVDAAVVGIPAVEYDDAPAAFVVLRHPDLASRETASLLKALVAERTDDVRQQLHAGVVFIDKLPRNNNGKVMKYDLKVLYPKAKVY